MSGADAARPWRKMAALLDHRLAARIEVHGVLVDMLGLGVLIVGESGIGKSECALELVEPRPSPGRGRHRRGAAPRGVDSSIGTCPEADAPSHGGARAGHHQHAGDLFGVRRRARSKSVDLVVQLERWDPTQRVRPARPRGCSATKCSGMQVPLVRMPVAPGPQHRHRWSKWRPAMSCCERAGYHAARTLAARLERQCAGRAPEPSKRRREVDAARRCRRRAAPRKPAAARFIVLTGLSGAGKSQAIRALEDLGYFCVDNLPTHAHADARRAVAPGGRRAAEGRAWSWTSARAASCREFPRVCRQLKATPGSNPALIFLEASHEALVRRFSETRRPHPLAPAGPSRRHPRGAPAAAADPRDGRRDHRHDSDLTVHQLRAAVAGVSRRRAARRASAGHAPQLRFQVGMPLDADLVFDVRFLPNPHFVPALRPKTGKDRAVVDVPAAATASPTSSWRSWRICCAFSFPNTSREGKSYLTVAIGCTGGRHRSVMIAEALRRSLRRPQGVQIRVHHRDVEQPT